MLAALPTKCGVLMRRSTHSVDVKAPTPKEQLLESLKKNQFVVARSLSLLVRKVISMLTQN
jgi:hypothetical protein